MAGELQGGEQRGRLRVGLDQFVLMVGIVLMAMGRAVIVGVSVKALQGVDGGVDERGMSLA